MEDQKTFRILTIFFIFLIVVLTGCTSKKIIILNSLIPAYAFTHTNETISVDGANTWTNITFGQEETDIEKNIIHVHAGSENDTFIIQDSGIYNLDYDFDIIDTSVGASNIDVAGRVILQNGTEIPGSVFTIELIKQDIETELSHNFFAKLFSGDEIIFQFISQDADVQISTHGTFGDKPESATIIIQKIANIE